MGNQEGQGEPEEGGEAGKGEEGDYQEEEGRFPIETGGQPSGLSSQF